MFQNTFEKISPRQPPCFKKKKYIYIYNFNRHKSLNKLSNSPEFTGLISIQLAIFIFSKFTAFFFSILDIKIRLSVTQYHNSSRTVLKLCLMAFLPARIISAHPAQFEHCQTAINNTKKFFKFIRPCNYFLEALIFYPHYPL